jgi:hypothetical protein
MPQQEGILILDKMSKVKTISDDRQEINGNGLANSHPATAEKA